MISSDRLSTFTLISGPRGSLKTLLMTAIQARRLLKAYYLTLRDGIKTEVWSNYPVAFNHKSAIDGKTVRLESKPLNMEALYIFDDEMARGWVFIDEVDQWYDRQDWSAVTQRLLNAGITQIRKRKLSIVSSIQNIQWLNIRGQFQVDINVLCREAAFSRWGRKNNLDLGEAAFLKWRDKSGFMTGIEYDESHLEYKQLFFGKRFWNCYDTDYQFNPLETKTKYKLKMPTKTIVVDSQGNLRPENAGSIRLESRKKDPNYVLLADLVYELKNDQGLAEIKKDEFWQMARERGFTGELWQGGTYIKDFGVEKANVRGSKYSLERVGGEGDIPLRTPDIGE